MQASLAGPRRGRDASREAGGVCAELAHALRLAVMRVNRRMRTEEGGAVTLSQISVMRTLAERGPLSPSALALLEGVKPPSMSRIVAALCKRGLVERLPHATDRRQSLIHLTVRGRALFETESPLAPVAALAGSIERLSSADQELLRAALPVIERLAEP